MIKKKARKSKWSVPVWNKTRNGLAVRARNTQNGNVETRSRRRSRRFAKFLRTLLRFALAQTVFSIRVGQRLTLALIYSTLSCRVTVAKITVRSRSQRKGSRKLRKIAIFRGAGLTNRSEFFSPAPRKITLAIWHSHATAIFQSGSRKHLIRLREISRFFGA